MLSSSSAQTKQNLKGRIKAALILGEEAFNSNLQKSTKAASSSVQQPAVVTSSVSGPVATVKPSAQFATAASTPATGRMKNMMFLINNKLILQLLHNLKQLHSNTKLYELLQLLS